MTLGELIFDGRASSKHGLISIGRFKKRLLDALDIGGAAAVIGGSTGGMATLEWPLCTRQGYVKTIIPIATCRYHSAWGNVLGELQRQCVYDHGNYTPSPSGQPTIGLGAARMIGMFGRNSICKKTSSLEKEATYRRGRHRPRNSVTLGRKKQLLADRLWEGCRSSKR